MSETSNTERSYVAFISYRHEALDREAAERVQKKIENYIVPKEFREQTDGKKLGLCFRDEDELPASSSLTDSIYYALDHSKFLIVICTPALPLSKWCEAEIRYFLKTHDRDHVLAVLADGDPSESFSPFMLHDFDSEGNITKDWEPLAANIAGEDHTINNKAFKKEIVRIYAALIGCPFDALWQREKRARTNRLLSLAGVAMAVLAVFLGVVLNRNAQIAAQSEQIAAQNDELVAKNQEIQTQNVKIEEQNTSLQTRLSTALVDSGMTKLKEHDLTGALEDGVKALDNEDPSVYDHRTIKLLSDALCAYKSDHIQSMIVCKQAQPIIDLEVSDDESTAVFMDFVGTLICMDLKTYEIKWSVITGDENSVFYLKNLGDRLLYKSKEGLFCCSLSDGSLLWSHEHAQNCENYFQSISEDGSIFAVADRAGTASYGPDNPVYIVFLDTADGRELGRTEMTRDNAEIDLSEVLFKPLDYASAFSPDNSSFACILPAEAEEDEKNIDAAVVFTIDLDSFKKANVGMLYDRLLMYYGMDINSEDQSVFFAGYSLSFGGIYSILCTKNGSDYEYHPLTSDHALRNPTGIGVDEESYLHNDCHFLSNGERILIFSDDDMFVFDRAENRLMRCYAMNDTVTNAFWADSSKKSFEVIISDGSVLGYDLGTDYMFDNVYVLSDIDQEDIRNAQPLNGGMLWNEESGMYLSAGGDGQNHILLARYISDPHLNTMTFDGLENVSGISEALFVPDSNTVFCRSSRNVFSFDRTNGEVLKETAFEDYFTFYDSCPLDEEHFVYEAKSYGLDGSVSDYGTPFFEDSTPVYPFYHKRLNDGSVLSWHISGTDSNYLEQAGVRSDDDPISSVFSAPNICLFWKDGEPIGSSADPAKAILLQNSYMADDSCYAVGKTGTALFYAQRVRIRNSELVTDENPAFYFYDTAAGTITSAENHFPGFGVEKISMGNNTGLAAVVYDTGNFCIYSSDSTSVVEPEQIYRAGEVTDLCFSKGDEYLAVITENDRLDLYDTASWNLVYSNIIDSLHEYGSVYGWSFDDLSVEYSTDKSRLIVMASMAYSGTGFCIVIDPSTWTVETEISDVLAYDSGTNTLFFRGDGTVFRSCTLYDMKSLKEWAASEIGS